MYVLGIDGGGTKTAGVITDQEGNLVAQGRVGATNPNSVDLTSVKKELNCLFTALKAQNGAAFSQLISVFAGMSGVDRAEDKMAITQLIKSFLPQGAKLSVDNDGVNALYSGTLGRAGIVNISGTGSITFGMNEKGLRKRAGGWGYLIGDLGSGYSIGRDALQSAFEAYDGCGKKTLLTELILQFTKAPSLSDLIPSIYELGKARKVIAPLSRLVVQAADQGDEVAQRILQKAANDMAVGIECLLTQLFHDRGRNSVSKIPVVLTGGVYSRSDCFIPTIKERLSRMNEAEIEFIVPDVPPVAGGVIAAWRNVDVDVEDRFVKLLFNNGLNNKE